jgi:hypothetical protein
VQEDGFAHDSSQDVAMQDRWTKLPATRRMTGVFPCVSKKGRRNVNDRVDLNPRMQHHACEGQAIKEIARTIWHCQSML